jgi:hypothetical protein
MADERVTHILGEYDFLWSQQANFRMLWNTIAQFVLPAWDNFIGEFAEGIIRTTRIFDATAITANERFAAIMESLLTPRTQMWHDLVPEDENLRDDPEVAEYCSQVRKILFAARYLPGANYSGSTDECYLQLGAFGNMCMLIDEVLGTQFLYRSIPLSEIVWSLNNAGMVDTVYRKFRQTAKQIMERWAPPSRSRTLSRKARSRSSTCCMRSVRTRTSCPARSGLVAWLSARPTSASRARPSSRRVATGPSPMPSVATGWLPGSTTDALLPRSPSRPYAPSTNRRRPLCGPDRSP